MHSRYPFFLLTFFLIASPALAQPGEASFEGLGFLPGGDSTSIAKDVSADGSVVVGVANCTGTIAQNCGEAFRWVADPGGGGVMEGLGDLPGGISASAAWGVSADGAVVVGIGNSEDRREAFRWEDGVLEGLGDLPGTNDGSAALAVNADGSVVVGVGNIEFNLAGDAFRWEAGEMEGLDILPGYTISVPWSVSGDGSVIVGDNFSFNPPFPNEAVRWVDGEIEGLGFLPGGMESSVANSVSPDGSVIVGDGNSESFPLEAFRWANGEMEGLGTLPSDNPRSSAKAVSANGFVVVGTAVLTGDVLVAFIWTGDEGMRNLKEVLEDDHDLDLTGWTLQFAEGISDDGTVIVGYGINPDGDTEAWRAVLPPSSTIPPAAIADLDGTPNPDGNSVTLAFTAPGADGDAGTALFYHIRHSDQPILTEADWENATPATFEATPDTAGTTEEIVVHGLDYGMTYHVNVRAEDEGFNVGDLSNDLEIETLDGPVANVPLDPIEVQLEAEGAGVQEFTISSTGSSTLTYSVGFAASTPEAQNGDPRGPRVFEGTYPPRSGEEEASPTGVAQLLGEDGPDTFGYRWIDSDEAAGPTYQWIDIVETGTEVELDADDFEIVDLPFDFPYYGDLFNQVSIESNGALSFGDTNINHTNQEIPVADDWNGMLAVHWDDFYLPEGGSVYYDTLDDGRFVVSWIDAVHFPGQGLYTFQAVLDARGTIRYHYREIAPASQDENSATVGIENLDGSDGLQVVYNAPYLQDELAIRFSTQWVESSLAGGAIPGGTDETLVLAFDATGLEPATYTTDMTVVTNEIGSGLTEEYVIPISLTVEGIGTDASPDELAEGLTMPHPNPVRGAATLAVAAREGQHVTVEVFDVTGRRVQTLYDGALAAGTAETLALDASALPAGVYVVRATGEDFTKTRRVTVVR